MFGGLENNITCYFGGLSVLLTSDFWQLHPTGDVAIMSKPYKHPSNIMIVMFWESHNIDWGLQAWMDSKSRVFCFERKSRSGADVWFDAFLEQARSGT
eukprot:127305-Karenia_brevis.AAC.1